MTTLYITVGDREATLQFVENTAANAIDETDQRPVSSARTTISSAVSHRCASNCLAIADTEPASMREPARLVDRDGSDVHSDPKHLEVVNVLELEAGGPGGAIQPVVPVERIEMHIDYARRRCR